MQIFTSTKGMRPNNLLVGTRKLQRAPQQSIKYKKNIFTYESTIEYFKIGLSSYFKSGG